MKYTKPRLLALRLHGDYAIRLAMRPKQGVFNANHSITLPLAPSTVTAVQNVNIGLINCQSIRNKSDEISHVVKDKDFDVFLSLQRLGCLVMLQTRKLLVM